MAVITDNVRTGTVKGLAKGVGTVGNVTATPAYLNGVGDPSDIVTAQTGSDIFYDATNAEYYMALGVGGSEWIRLVSGA